MSQEPSPRSTSMWVTRPQTAGTTPWSGRATGVVERVIGSPCSYVRGRRRSLRHPARRQRFHRPAPAEEGGDGDERDRDDEDDRPDDVDLRWQVVADGAPDPDGERVGRAGREVGHHEVVDGERESQQAAGQDAREDEREGDPPEGRPFVRPEVGRGFLEVAVEALDTRAHGDHHEADVEHDVGDDDRPQPERVEDALGDEALERGQDPAVDSLRQPPGPHARPPVSSSVPSTFAYSAMASRMAPMRMNESALATG